MKELNLNMETKNFIVDLPYIFYRWNTKRSGKSLNAFWNNTMSGIVIVLKSNNPNDKIK